MICLVMKISRLIEKVQHSANDGIVWDEKYII